MVSSRTPNRPVATWVMTWSSYSSSSSGYPPSPVQVNESLTLDFANQSDFEEHHYAFLVGEDDFDEIFGRITDEGLVYGSGPRSADDGQINRRRGGRGLYFRGGPDTHLWEIMTRRETGT